MRPLCYNPPPPRNRAQKAKLQWAATPPRRRRRCSCEGCPRVILYLSLVMALQSQTITLQAQVVDSDSGKLIACRLYIQRSDGSWHYAKPAVPTGSAVEYKRKAFNGANSYEYHTCLSAHPFITELEPGRYILTAEHGKEYV